MASRSVAQGRAEHSRRGFSLVEVIVVMVLVSILAVGAAMSSSSAATVRSRIAAQTVARDLTFARRTAMATGTPTWVIFTPASDSYIILVQDNTNPGRSHAVAMTDPATGLAFNQSFAAAPLLADITSASIGSGAEVGFDWRGAPTDAAGAALTSSGSVVVAGTTITIEPVTGAISQP